jgi:uncharacterized membrane protein YfhO
MHTPNMFLHRYSFVFSLLIILMAAETLTRLSEIRLRWLGFTVFVLTTGFTATVLSRHYSYVKNPYLLNLIIRPSLSHYPHG